jgi:hypothetical protein
MPIETAPKDVTILLYGAKRLEMCVGMHHSRDGWVTDTTSEWMSMYPPTHWMPLPAAPDHLRDTTEKAAPAEDFCYCDDDISLQMVSGGAALEGLYGRVTLKINGQYVDYVKAQPAPAEPVALESVHLTRDINGMCTVRVNGRVAIQDNGDIIDHMATLEWFAQPAPVPLTDTETHAELWKLAVRKGLVTVRSELIDPRNHGTRVSWMQGHDKACDISNDAAAHGIAASPAAPAAPVVPLTDERITKALRRAFSLGQTYWQQADSDSYTVQNAKSDETRQKFETLTRGARKSPSQ